ncbi:MAG: hypothetical protein CVT81_15595 [Alphaproteobacteria bacterium HGW-Alphaproteobacteria-3]|jgi:hypothetical protein|nr:MAG: hypothetical protein CVT81_15595 [Alphaproteobacteria bacterium HGW-Alphaproteobacteria-3]
MKNRWRTGDLVRAIPIARADLHQAISRDGYRPEYKQEPGKDRWHSWRDAVAIAAAQELRIIGYGPKVAFGLVQNHLSPFLRTKVEQPDDCADVLWLINQLNALIGEKHRCEFVRYADNDAIFIDLNQCACIVVNLGRIAHRILNDLQESEKSA